ncbi:9124_t:CDS:2 [Ambispora leptoticha]|uniref:9124_t:CDS:1 n=1 Tax=Ambispora leptoticha TaxID=144679 RepID=A0A9N9B6Q1_9GLOM|nr:9124_t:CDS:2 [Ambispora leptoticha]
MNPLRTLRIYFHVPVTPKNQSEIRRIFKWFAQRGALSTYLMGRSPESKRYQRYGFITYKDDAVAEELLSNEFYPVDFYDDPIRIPLNQRLIWKGFFTKDDSPQKTDIATDEVDAGNFKNTAVDFDKV